LFGLADGGVTERAARLPSALAGVAGLAIVLRVGARLVGARAAAFGAALLATTYSYAHLARRAQFDVLLTAFEWLALLAFVRLERGEGSRRGSVAMFHAALGLAVLTKGPVGLLLPCLGIAILLARERRLAALRPLLAPWGLLLSLGPGLAWIAAAAALAPPEFLGEAVGTNLLGRFFAGTSHERPFYYFFYQLPVEFLPWTLALPVVWLAARHAPAAEQAAGRRFLWTWVVVNFVFFSLSSGKRGLYLVPTLPALALLLADAWVRVAAARRTLPPSANLALALAAALLAGLAGYAALQGGIGRTQVPPALPIAWLAAIAAAALAWWVAARARRSALLRGGLVIALVYAIELSAFLLLYPALDPDKSPRSIAEAAAELTEPDAAVGLVGDRALVGGLAYYARRRIATLDSPDSIRAFLEGGGRAIVVKERKLARIEAIAPVDVRARARHGRRALVVVSPRPAASAGPR
jgi:4-amino-4-deoxy-L-arabinose transferase-like glycosyltransferase